MYRESLLRALRLFDPFSRKREKRVRSSRPGVRTGGGRQTLEAAVAFRNLTFPFCRPSVRTSRAGPLLPKPFSPLLRASTLLSEPFGQTRTAPPRIAARSRLPYLPSSSSRPPTRGSQDHPGPGRDDNSRTRERQRGRLIGSLNYFSRRAFARVQPLSNGDSIIARAMRPSNNKRETEGKRQGCRERGLIQFGNIVMRGNHR